MILDYHDLSEDDFERLVVCICGEILGPGIVAFAKGKDGSRDARFEGDALHLPNLANPHKGKFIVQAKHTDNPVAKYSDTDFSGDSNSAVLTKEMIGVKKLVAAGHLDNYLLFANRKMTGVAEEPIKNRITEYTGAKVVELFGVERMDYLLRKFPDALRVFGAEPQSLPLLVTCEDIAEVVLAISKNLDAFQEAFSLDSLQRVSFREKNEINTLGDELAALIRRDYVPLFADVKAFLAKPGNEAVLERYLCAVAELKEQIAVHRNTYTKFDHVLLRIKQLLFHRDCDLARRKRLVNLIVYYMYWICDIGTEVKANATAD